MRAPTPITCHRPNRVMTRSFPATSYIRGPLPPVAVINKDTIL